MRESSFRGGRKEGGVQAKSVSEREGFPALALQYGKRGGNAGPAKERGAPVLDAGIREDK